MKPEDIAAADLAGMLKAGAALPIDVRENDEFSEGHIAGAVSRPLSRFDPRALPEPAGKKVVFYCAGGIRSARAIAACHSAGIPYHAHLKGGVCAWQANGYPLER